MGMLARRGHPTGWWPSADAVNASREILLRADNLIWDESLPTIRRGSVLLNLTPYAEDSVDSVMSVRLAGNKIKMAGAGDHMYAEHVQLPALFDGTSDIHQTSWLRQAIAARGTKKTKYDGTTQRNLGIAAPTMPLLIEVTPEVFKQIATCDQADAEFTAETGNITGTYPSGELGEANGAVQVTPDSDGRSTIVKTFSADTDFSRLLDSDAYPEDEMDLFEMSVFIGKPEGIEYVTVMFGVSDTADPFADYYYFDFLFGPVRTSTVVIKDPDVAKKGVDKKADKQDPNAGKEAKEKIDKNKDRDKSDKSRERKDPDVWGRYAAQRGAFSRVGASSTRDWSTVKAFKIVFKGGAGKGSIVSFDNVKFFSSAATLSGKFKFHYRWVKQFDDFIEISPASPLSEEVVLRYQSVIAIVQKGAIDAADPQVSAVWIYAEGGFLDQPYKIMEGGDAKEGALAAPVYPHYIGSLLGLPLLPNEAKGTPTHEDLVRMCCRGFGLPGDRDSSFTFMVRANEIDALIANEPGLNDVLPPDNIIGMVGPYYDRMLCLAQDAETGRGQLHLSRRHKPGSYYPFQVFDIGDATEIMYWIILTDQAAYIGTSKDIYFVSGTGDENPDLTVNLTVQRLNIGSPPINECVAAYGNSVFYMGDDGPRALSGATAQLIGGEAIEPLYKNVARYGIQPVDFEGRMRCATSGGVVSFLVQEKDGKRVLHRFDLKREKWLRHTYEPTMFRSPTRDVDGALLAGDDNGHMWLLDSGDTDDGYSIPIIVWTTMDDDALPWNRKDPMDFHLHVDTGGLPLTADIHLDGSTAIARRHTVRSDGQGIFKSSIGALAAFRQVQLRLTGFFRNFKWYQHVLNYRTRPRMRMHLDTGYLQTGREDLTWIREIRIAVNAEANITITPYFDDVAFTGQTVAVTTSKTTVYTIQLGPEFKGYMPRVVIDSASTANIGEIGFECYWIEMRMDKTGNVTSKDILRINPEQVP